MFQSTMVWHLFEISLHNGSFSTATSFTTQNSSALDVGLGLGDLDGDGNLDLITDGVSGTDGYTTVRLGDGKGSFGEGTSFYSQPGASRGLDLGDVDGDGVLDMVTVSYTGVTNIHLGETASGVAPLLEFSIETTAEAKQAIPIFQRKREQLAQKRGEIGANQVGIEVATNVLTVAVENFKSAESRIRDVDIASEAAKLTRLNILQQAVRSILAQANQQPALALSLLN